MANRPESDSPLWYLWVERAHSRCFAGVYPSSRFGWKRVCWNGQLLCATSLAPRFISWVSNVFFDPFGFLHVSLGFDGNHSQHKIESERVEGAGPVRG